jgi:hypoxanthine phosphoribosyltransferase
LSPAAPRTLYSAATIAQRTAELAQAIVARAGPDIFAVPILNGALVFAADLVRALARAGADVEVQAIRMQSYGKATSAEGPPDMRLALDRRIDGRTALIIDGVCDTGASLKLARDHLTEQGAARVFSAVIVDKRYRRASAVAPDFIGFDGGRHFVAGYGMDAAGRYRHLPDIVSLDS